MPNLKKFYTLLKGETLGCHREINQWLISSGRTEVWTSEECDFVMVYLPIVSRLGSDIQAALEGINTDKPVILVVLHHTFNPDYVVPDSSRHMTRNVLLTVNCLFHETKGLLKCDNNKRAAADILNELPPLKVGINNVNRKLTCPQLIMWLCVVLLLIILVLVFGYIVLA